MEVIPLRLPSTINDSICLRSVSFLLNITVTLFFSPGLVGPPLVRKTLFSVKGRDFSLVWYSLWRRWSRDFGHSCLRRMRGVRSSYSLTFPSPRGPAFRGKSYCTRPRSKRSVELFLFSTELSLDLKLSKRINGLYLLILVSSVSTIINHSTPPPP